jgi:hypothetical protein
VKRLRSDKSRETPKSSDDVSLRISTPQGESISGVRNQTRGSVDRSKSNRASRVELRWGPEVRQGFTQTARQCPDGNARQKWPKSRQFPPLSTPRDSASKRIVLGWCGSVFVIKDQGLYSGGVLARLTPHE